MESGLRFMPAPQSNRDALPTLTPELLDQIKSQTKTLAAIHIDRMKVGEYKGIPLQGGMFYPTIGENLQNGVVWAFNSPGVARGVARRAAENNGFVKLVLMQEGNVVGNKTFTHVWFRDLQDNIAAKRISKSTALKELNAIREKFAKHKESKLATGHTKAWKTLEEAFSDIVSMPQQKRASTYFQKSKTQTKSEGEKIAYQSLLSQKMTKQGFPDAVKIVDSIEEPAFKGIPSGAAVGIIRIDPIGENSKILTGTEAGVPEHLSYEYVLKGKPIAKMSVFSVIEQIAPETKGQMLTQAAMNFPVEKSVPLKPTGGQSIRYMPSDSDYLAAVKSGDTAKAQELVDQAAKAAGLFNGLGKRLSKWAANDVDNSIAKVSFRNPDTGEVNTFGDVANDFRSITDERAVEYVRWLQSVSFKTDKQKDILSDIVFLSRVPQVVSRDLSGNIIPLSQRFQQSSADIRYMPAALVPDPTIPGAYSMSGYRVLPGKSKSRLRVYSPTGSLIGIAASTDEAQRLIQKKLR